MAARASAAVVAALLSMIAVVAALAWIPTSTPLSPWNAGPRGASRLNATPTQSLAGVPCGSKVIVPLEEPPSESLARQLEALASCGSTIVVLDSRGYSTSLLEPLGLGVAVENATIIDEVSAAGEPWIVNATLSIPWLNETLHVAIPKPRLTLYTTPPQAAGYTSPYAYADLDHNWHLSMADRVGSYAVVALWRRGNSTIVLIPSLEAAWNNYSTGLTALLGALPGGPTLYYTGALSLTGLDKLKASLARSPKSLPPPLAGAIAIGVAASLAGAYLAGSRPTASPPALAGTAAALAIAALLTGKTLVGATALVAAALASVPRARWLAASLLVAAALEASGEVPGGWMLYLAAVLAAVYSGPGGGGAWVLGPTSYSSLVLQAYLAPLILLEPLLATRLAFAAIASATLGAAGYLALRAYHVEVQPPPSEAPLGSSVSVILRLEGPTHAALEIWGPRGPRIAVVAPGEALEYEYPLDSTGLHRIRLEVALGDPLGLARRTFTETFEIMAIPVLEALRSKVAGILAGAGGAEEHLRAVRVAAAKLERPRALAAAGRRGPAVRESPGALAQGYGAGAGSGLGEIGSSGEAWRSVAPRGLLETILALVGDSSQMPGGRSEYLGPRPFVAGDRIADIHWKKSIEKQELVVKEWNREHGGGPRGGGAAGSGGASVDVVIVNVEASKPDDLDAVLYRALSILEASKYKAWTTLALVRGRDYLVLQGPPQGLLAALAEATKIWRLSVPYRYRAPARPSEALKATASSIGSRGPHAVVAVYNAWRAQQLAVAIRKAGPAPPAYFTLIHAPPAGVWAAVTARVLSLVGYAEAPRISIQAPATGVHGGHA